MWEFYITQDYTLLCVFVLVACATLHTTKLRKGVTVDIKQHLHTLCHTPP